MRRLSRGALAAAGLAILAGLLLTSDHDPAQAVPGPVDELLASLDTREKIQQLFIVGFRGPDVSVEMNRFIAENKVGGVFLSAANCNIINGSDFDPRACDFADGADPDTPAQVAKLTQALQDASCTATGGLLQGEPYCLPLFISVDHEGDDRPLTRLLNRFTPAPSSMAVGATFDSTHAKALGCIVGEEMAAVGVNLLLGPDLDVLDHPTSGTEGDQGIRVFGGDPLWVSEMGEAYIEGAHQCSKGRLATMAKHFPGHGLSTRDVDTDDVNLVTKTLLDLRKVDLAPFTAVSEGDPSGVTDAIMNSHLTYTEVVGCDGSTPVTFSPNCMETFVSASLSNWRQSSGVTMADALSAGAVINWANTKFGTYAPGLIAEDALLAGNDLLPLIISWEWEALSPTVDYLVSRYDAEPMLKERIDDAARRVLGLKHRLYGGLNPSDVTAAPDSSFVVGSAKSAAAVSAIAEAALTFIRPKGRDAFLAGYSPPTARQRILFIECWDDSTCTENLEKFPPLWPRGKLADLAVEMFPDLVSAERSKSIGFGDLRAVMDGAGSSEAIAAFEDADWLVFAFLELDPNLRSGSSLVLKDFLKSPDLLRDKTVAVFAYNSPYHLDAGEMRNVDLFIALYSKIEPSLRASLKALFQDRTISLGAAGLGSLPVDYILGNFMESKLSEQVQAAFQAVDLVFDPAEPLPGEKLTVSLVDLLAVNGHIVANGTAVKFVFELPDGRSKQVIASTVKGEASVSIDALPEGAVSIVVTSGKLNAQQTINVNPNGPTRPDSSGPGTPGQTTGGGSIPVLLIVSLAAGFPLASLALALAVYLRRRAGSPSSNSSGE